MNTIGSETLESEASIRHAERDQVVCVYLNYFIKSCITLIKKWMNGKISEREKSSTQGDLRNNPFKINIESIARVKWHKIVFILNAIALNSPWNPKPQAKKCRSNIPNKAPEKQK